MKQIIAIVAVISSLSGCVAFNDFIDDLNAGMGAYQGAWSNYNYTIDTYHSPSMYTPPAYTPSTTYTPEAPVYRGGGGWIGSNTGGSLGLVAQPSRCSQADSWRWPECSDYRPPAPIAEPAPPRPIATAPRPSSGCAITRTCGVVAR